MFLHMWETNCVQGGHQRFDTMFSDVTRCRSLLDPHGSAAEHLESPPGDPEVQSGT